MPGIATTTTAIAITAPVAITTEVGDPTPGTPEFEATAGQMAAEYEAATTDIRRLLGDLHAATVRLDNAFRTAFELANPEYCYNRFAVDVHYDGSRHGLAPDRDGIDDVIEGMSRKAWTVLVDKLGIKNVMSVAKRKAFDEQLERGELPPINEQTIAGILLGLTGQVQDFAREAAREVFDILRPSGNHGGGQYKTNNAFRVGRRVILTNRIESGYRGGFRVSHYYEQQLTALDGVFHLMDGNGVMREHRGPLVAAINATADAACRGDSVGAAGRVETEYFRVKCYKNRNLHIEFKKLELVKQLNLLATGERVLGEDME